MEKQAEFEIRGPEVVQELRDVGAVEFSSSLQLKDDAGLD